LVPGVMIRVEGVRVEYESKKVLADVDLEIGAGEFVSLVGQTGCGKSTLLRLILAEEAPSSGRVLVEGVERHQPDRHSGYVPQKYSLFPDKTVLDNIMFGLEVSQFGLLALFQPGYWKARKAFRAQALEYVRTVGLHESDAGKYPHQLSGGMQQRVAIAQALIMQPKILLMDEAFSALDPGTRSGMQRLIKKIWRETGTTILFVTHNTREAISLSTRIVALAKSTVEGQGSTVALDLPVPDPLSESKITDLIHYIEEHTQPMSALKKGTTEPDYVVLQAPRA
jgi:NitT/TauT family transport system ATP-binding protein